MHLHDRAGTLASIYIYIYIYIYMMGMTPEGTEHLRERADISVKP